MKQELIDDYIIIPNTKDNNKDIIKVHHVWEYAFIFCS